MGYKGYPAAICISPNEMVVHGIPGRYVVEEGDVVTIDVGVTLDGMIADSALHVRRRRARPRGAAAARGRVARPRRGIEQARPGNRIGDISHAVQRVVEEAGFSVVRALVGHGVGRHYHEDPHVPNFGEPGRGPLLAEGMTIAIEPMITAGGPDVVIARRRMDDLDRRRLPLRPLRAHGRDHAPTGLGS